jgi:hypothetical protein
MKPLRLHPQRCKKSVQKNLLGYTDSSGCQVRSGRRQSMPSSNIDSCARVKVRMTFVYSYCLVGCRRTVTSEAQAIAYQLCIAVLKGPEGH